MVEKIGYPEMCVNKTLLGEYYQQARDKYVNVKFTKVCFFLWRDKIFLRQIGCFMMIKDVNIIVWLLF